MKRELVYPELSYEITGMLFAAHNELGKFRSEKQYGDFIELKLRERGIPYEREKVLAISFEGETSGRNRIDFIVDNKILLELKCKRVLDRDDYYQVQRYLVALNKKLGLLINFNVKYLAPRRVLNPLCKD